MKMYRIYNTKTGLYSDGGIRASFSKNGKMWEDRTFLIRHLKYLVECGRYYCKDISCLFEGEFAPYKDCLIVEYDIVIGRQQSINVFLERGN